MSEPSVAVLKEWIRNPALFVHQNFKIDPDEWQVDYLNAYAHGKSNRTAAAACKGPGKTAVMSWAGWHFLSMHPDSKVPCTSITGPNLKDGLWSEFAKWQNRSEYLKKEFRWTQTRIYQKDHPETWFASARSWAQDADPEQQANTLAGIHADFLLFLIDECSNIPDGVVSAAEGALTSGKKVKLLMAGNCTRTAGPLWRAVGADRHLWNIVRITGDPDDPKRSPRINLEEARTQIAKYGRDSYIVRVNILGVFPERQADKLIDVADCEKAMRRSLHESAFQNEARVIGVDVARFGDDESVLFPRQGRMAFEPRIFRELDTRELGDQICLSIDRWNPDVVNIDAGAMGIAVYDHCRHRGYGSVVRAINFGGRAKDEERFENKRGEMWWEAAEWVRGGGCLPNQPMLTEELAEPVYFHNKKNQVCLEPKDDIKARIGRSPDRGDSFVLTFASPVRPPSAYGGRRGASGEAEVRRNPLSERRVN